jgi:hypothetical protein
MNAEANVGRVTLGCDPALSDLRCEREALFDSLVLELSGIPPGASIQWTQNGTLLAGETSAALCLSNLSPNDADLYYAIVSVDDRQRLSQKALVVVLPGNTILNASARGYVTSERPLTVGFVVGRAPRAPKSKYYLIRGVGPSLAKFGVKEPVMHPTIALQRRGRLVDSTVAISAEELARHAESIGATALIGGSSDVVRLVELPPGPYTITGACSAGEGGELLVEVYETKYMPEGP